MAINFAEVFLRESGAEQDRAKSMAEMQLRANQFAQNLALQEAQLEINKRAQTLAEQQAEANNINEVNRLAEQARQFDAELENRKDEFAANLEQRQKELGLSRDELNARISQFNRSLDQESERLKQETALAYDRLDQDLKLSLSQQNLTAEMFYADLDFKRPKEEAQTKAIQAGTDLTREEIKGIAIDNDIKTLELTARRRGIELSQLPIPDDMKERLGYKKNEDGTYPEVLADQAMALLEMDQIALGLEQQDAARQLSQMRTELQMAPFNEELTRENIRRIKELYPKAAQRSGVRTTLDQFAFTFLNPASFGDSRAMIDFVTAPFRGTIRAISPTGRFYDLQRATGVDAAEFANPLAGEEGLLGRSLMESQLSPAQQNYFEFLNESGSLFADPATEFTRGAFLTDPPFPVPFAPSALPTGFLPQVSAEDLEE